MYRLVTPPPTRFSRADTSHLGQWWWTIDRWMLLTLLVLMLLGILLLLAASPPVAERIGVDDFHFVKRQLFLFPIALAILFATSFLSPSKIKMIALIVCAGTLLLMVVTLFIGVDVKGAKRWINMGGFSLQPSEFLKPSLAVLWGWIFSIELKDKKFPGKKIALGLYAVAIFLLIQQPDLGMSVVVSGILCIQLFLAGLSTIWIAVMALVGIFGLIGAYLFLPHVTVRINSFLDPQSSDNYQINTSMEAFTQGGFFGRGPGEGIVKNRLPDAHSDFIFSVAGEEYGFILCMGIILLFVFIFSRGVMRATQEKNLFFMLSVLGLLTQFVLQALINMASSVHLIPTKGMTLPFLSYGGSSLLAMSYCMGMVLALTRRRIYHGT